LKVIVSIRTLKIAQGIIQKFGSTSCKNFQTLDFHTSSLGPLQMNLDFCTYKQHACWPGCLWQLFPTQSFIPLEGLKKAMTEKNAAWGCWSLAPYTHQNDGSIPPSRPCLPAMFGSPWVDLLWHFPPKKNMLNTFQMGTMSLFHPQTPQTQIQ
jgi:hypothetical protein